MAEEELSIIIRFRSVLKCRNGNEMRAHKLSAEFCGTERPHFPPTDTAANRAPNRILFNFRRPRILLMSFLTCPEAGAAQRTRRGGQTAPK